MDRFLHTSVRLRTDLGRATRFFIKPDQLMRWLCDQAVLSANGTDMQLSAVNTAEDCWVWKIEEIEPEKRITILCSDILQQGSTHRFPLEIRLMKCTSVTEYCSEIHLLQHGFEDTETGNSLRAQYLNLWETKLETLRALVNGKWIIEDKDLTLDLFK